MQVLFFYKKKAFILKAAQQISTVCLFCLYDLEQASKLLHQSVASCLQVPFLATSFITYTLHTNCHIRSASTSDSSFIEQFFSLCRCLSL